MSADTTKAMEEALQAAVARMNSPSAEPHSMAGDAMGALAAILPRLLHNDDAAEDLTEKLEALQKSDLAPLRDQVAVLRKQCFRMLKSQEQLLVRVQEIQRQQTAVAAAVLDLARQMARITLIEDGLAGDEDYDREFPPAPGAYGRAESRSGRDGRGRRTGRETGSARL